MNLTFVRKNTIYVLANKKRFHKKKLAGCLCKSGYQIEIFIFNSNLQIRYDVVGTSMARRESLMFL